MQEPLWEKRLNGGQKGKSTATAHGNSLLPRETGIGKPSKPSPLSICTWFLPFSSLKYRVCFKLGKNLGINFFVSNLNSDISIFDYSSHSVQKVVDFLTLAKNRIKINLENQNFRSKCWLVWPPEWLEHGLPLFPLQPLTACHSVHCAHCAQ